MIFVCAGMPVTVCDVERPTPRARLRIWTNDVGSDGRDLLASEVVVEWAGQSGHPTSYALLGGLRRGDGGTLSAPSAGPPYRSSLAGRADHVTFGLPVSYRDEVATMIQRSLRPVEVTLAAHGVAGSSRMAFRRVTVFLLNLIELDLVSTSDAELWEAWDGAGA
jgi:hypothetical protein